jgi:streptogramin lyase
MPFECDGDHTFIFILTWLADGSRMRADDIARAAPRGSFCEAFRRSRRPRAVGAQKKMRGNAMRSFAPLGVIGLFVFAASLADAATITGTVTGPDGAPMRGAFVQARHAKLKMTVSVLSDSQGRYVVENLPAGEYRLQVRAIGTKSDPKSGIDLAADQNVSQDFALQQGVVRWSDLTILQGLQLLPEARGKQTLFDNCLSCHGFQSKMAAVVMDEDGWRARVEFMREAMRSSLADRQGFSDAQADDVVFYLNHLFSEQSVLPKSPAELPAYKDTVATFDDEALKIVYVDYEMPGPNRFPWTAHPDKDGTFWIPQYGVSNRIAHFNPATGEIKEFRVPNMGPALIHSAVPAPDGSVWMTQAGSKKLGRWDPATQKITEFQDDWRKHTIQVHPDGSIWSTGGLTRFDPTTQTYTHIPEVPTAYGIALDKEGTVWFTEMTRAGSIGKVDPKTLKVTKYIPPTRDRPRRMQIDADGMIWFCVYESGKIARFDPKTETFKEFALPNAKTKPYALGIGTDGMIWYSSEWRDIMGRLDPATGKVTEFPMPYTDNGMRDFFLDKDGHIWFGTPPNNRVGYFYLSAKQRNAEVK